MTRKSLPPGARLGIGFALSLLTLFVLIFIVKFCAVLYTKAFPQDSAYHFPWLVDLAGRLVDFANPVVDIGMLIAIVGLGIGYYLAWSQRGKKTG